ncbi:hypothetical protein HY990_03980 [Candidatus Micrarchaeota archaeon]|nr:hypothetical protein [Candidatus Micrarchaeota archaeon]
MRSYLLCLLLVSIFLFGCVSKPVSSNLSTVDVSNAITQSMCDQYGGHWNGTSCVCGGFPGFRCPPTYFCTNYSPEYASDAMGVCKRVSQ